MRRSRAILHSGCCESLEYVCTCAHPSPPSPMGSVSDYWVQDGFASTNWSYDFDLHSLGHLMGSEISVRDMVYMGRFRVHIFNGIGESGRQSALLGSTI